MKITLNTKVFAETLQVGGSYAFGGIKRFLPITECVKIEIKDKVLRIFSTDSENAISKRYGDIDAEDYAFCVQYKDLMDYVKLIDSLSFSIEVHEEKKRVSITHDDGNMKFPLEDEREFPKLPFVEKDDISYKIDANLLKTWIRVGDPFLIHDELKPQNESLYFDFHKGESAFCAGNGQTILFGFLKSQEEIDNLTVIIKKINFRNILNAIGSSDSIRMWNKDNHILFAVNGVLLSLRKMDIKYYNFKSVVTPCINNSTIKLVTDRHDLINAIKRIMIVRGMYNSILFSAKDNVLSLYSNNSDYDKDSSETLSCESNDVIDIQVSGEMVLKALLCFQSDKIILSFKDYSSPFIISSEDEYYRALLMPQMFNPKEKKNEN